MIPISLLRHLATGQKVENGSNKINYLSLKLLEDSKERATLPGQEACTGSCTCPCTPNPFRHKRLSFKKTLPTSPFRHWPIVKSVRLTGVPRLEGTPSPLGLPQVPRHRATTWYYQGGGSYERGTPVPGQEACTGSCTCPCTPNLKVVSL